MSTRRKFRFIREIAQGGFGTVYLAEMITGEDFSTVVAVKLLHKQWSQHQEVVMRSRDEARLLGRLRHRHIVRVEDLTSVQGHCAVVMEYLEGIDLGTLETWSKEREERFSPRMVLQVVGAVAAALEAAYTHVPLQGGEPLRLVHRDIKPSNIMVTSEGEVKLLDFGTARANFETREAHTEALHFGSQAYMAPERFMGDPDTPACDIFALGITLFELLSGEPGGRIQLREERFDAQLDENIAKLGLDSLEPELLSELSDVIRKMMAFHSEDRLSAADVEEAMETLSERVPGLTLRRFSKLHVKDILDSLAASELSEDSLVGRTLVEDRSAAIDAEGLKELADLAIELKPGEGGAATSAGWLVGPDDDSDEFEDSSDPTQDLVGIDEEPLWTSETYPGEQGNAGVATVESAPSADVAPSPNVLSPEATTAPSPLDTGTIDFEKGSLGEDYPETRSKRGLIWGAVVAALGGGAILFSGGDSEKVSSSSTPEITVAADAPQEAPPAESGVVEPVVPSATETPALEEAGSVSAPGVPKAATPTTPSSPAAELGGGTVVKSPPAVVEADPVKEEVAAPEEAPPKPSTKASQEPGALLLLTLSVGGAEIKLTSSDGFLRICREPCIRLEASGLPPGTYRTRVTPKGGGQAVFLDVRVRSGKSCRYNLKKQGEDMSWEERGCE